LFFYATGLLLSIFDYQIEGGENDYEGGADGDAADLDRELGDDVFGGNDNADVDDETSKLGHEAWVGTDRDYTYPEVGILNCCDDVLF
jgi:hypothetical protein